MALEGQDVEAVLGGSREAEPPDRRELRAIQIPFQGNLARHLGGMFSSESQVNLSPLAIEAVWKVQTGKQALAY